MTAIVELARAKVNLTLQVVGRREDGYHNLESLVAFASVGDRLTFEKASNSSGVTLEIEGRFAAALKGQKVESNLVVQAAQALGELSGRRPAARITLEKNLPVASGIGGGSADAAATLRGLSRLWGLHLPDSDLETLAFKLGADVPVCIQSHTAWMAGVGEQLSPAPSLPHHPVVLVNPGIGVSTPAVFKALDGRFSHAEARPESLVDSKDLVVFLKKAGNDLEVPAIGIEPVIHECLDALRESKGCYFDAMSGSGATCFGLFQSVEEADRAAGAIKAVRPGWWVASTYLGG